MSHDAPRLVTEGPRLGPIDALILVASIALGVGLSATDPKDLESTLGLGNTQARFEKEKDWTLVRQVAGRGQADAAAYKRIIVLDRVRWKRRVLLAAGQVVLPVITLGAGLATFRHRAARSRRSLRHIGVLTIAVAAIFVALSLVNEFLLRRFYAPPPRFGSTTGHPNFDSIWWDLGQDTGLAIAALWIILALGGRWRASRDWFDRLGRLIGAGWIVSTVAALLLMYALMPR
jgi:hypothetical protein